MSASSLLRDWRKARSLSQAELAKRIGVSQAAYCLWELGQRLPKLPHLYAIQRVTRGAVKLKDWVRDDCDVHEPISPS